MQFFLLQGYKLEDVMDKQSGRLLRVTLFLLNSEFWTFTLEKFYEAYMWIPTNYTCMNGSRPVEHKSNVKIHVGHSILKIWNSKEDPLFQQKLSLCCVIKLSSLPLPQKQCHLWIPWSISFLKMYTFARVGCKLVKLFIFKCATAHFAKN